MKRFSSPRMHSPGLPLSRDSGSLRQPAAAPIWQLSALIATGALVAFLLVRAVQLSLLVSALPPVPVKTPVTPLETVTASAPVTPPVQVAQSEETPASAWPPPSSPSADNWSGRQTPYYSYRYSRTYPSTVYYRYYYGPSGSNGTDEYSNRSYSPYSRGYANPTQFYSYGDDGF